MTFSAGSASYGNQTAAAAPEVVSWPVSSAKIVTSHLPSTKTMPQVSPETPAPMTAARFRMRSGIHPQNGRPGEPAGAQSRQSLVCLCQRKCFCFSPYWDTRRNFQKLRAIAPSQIRDRTNCPFTPQIAIWEARDIAHVNSSGNYDTAFIEMTQCNRHECSDRREDDGAIQFFGRRLVRSASPNSTETLRKFLGLGIPEPANDENCMSFINRYLSIDMGSQAEHATDH